MNTTTVEPASDGADAGFLGALFLLVGADHAPLGVWFSRLARHYLAGRHEQPQRLVGEGLSEEDRAERIIRRACWRSSAAGAAAAGVSTGAVLLVAEFGPLGLAAGVPTTALAIGGEMIYRALAHIEMCCALGSLYGVEFRAEEPWDLWRLYALAFESGRGVVERPRFEIERLTRHETTGRSDVISYEILCESILRNIVPVVGIGLSAWRNWQLSRQVGESVHRYVRFRRNRREVFAEHEPSWQRYLELIVESFWFVFTADGNISDEEIALLANYLERLPAEAQARLLERFVQDEEGWLGRLAAVPQGDRDLVMHAIEHAATVDLRVLRPEEQVLRRAARALERTFDLQRVREMIHRLDGAGTPRSHGAPHARPLCST